MVDPAALVFALLLLLVAATVQGFFGFGFGIFAMGGLTFSHDLIHASGLVNVTGLLLTGSLAYRLRSELLWPLLRRMLPAVLLGVAVGVTALRVVDREIMVRTLGATVVLIAAWNLASPALRSGETPGRDVAVGFIGGLLGGAFNTGGPPLVAHLYSRSEEPEALKATLQAIFLGIGLSRLPLAAAHGLLASSIWRDAALAAPLILLGSACGAALAQRVSPERFRRACWIGFALLGAALLAVA